MKISKYGRLSACILALTSCAWTQEAAHDAVSGNASSQGVLGYLDTKTGSFQPLSQAAAEPAASLAFTTLGGQIEYKMTVTIKSSIPTTTPIACTGTASVFDGSSNASYSETATMTAARSGSTATCTVLVPYSWSLASASTDSVTLTYTVSAIVSATATRVGTHALPAIKVPGNGATTIETIAVTI